MSPNIWSLQERKYKMYIFDSWRQNRWPNTIHHAKSSQVQQERIQMAQATASCIKANEHYVSYTWWRWKCLNSQTPGSLQKHSRAEDTAVNHNHCGMFVWEVVCHCWFSWPTPSFGWMAEHKSTKLKLSTHISVGVHCILLCTTSGFHALLGNRTSCKLLSLFSTTQTMYLLS